MSRAWSEIELEFLRQFYRTKSAAEIARMLARSYQSVVHKAFVLGLSRPRPMPAPTAAEYLELADECAREAHVDRTKMLAGDNARRYVHARWMVFRRLRARGYGLKGIAHISGFDHSTVYYGLHRRIDITEVAA